MMKEIEVACPHCGKELVLMSECWKKARLSGGGTLCKTQCCHKLIMLYPQDAYIAIAYAGDKTEDDWGE